MHFVGLTADKPYFMQKNRPTFYLPVDDSSESDSEWVPAKNKPRPKKPGENLFCLSYVIKTVFFKSLLI